MVLIMQIPVRNNSSKTYSKSQTSDGQVKSIKDLRILADSAIVELFNAFALDVRALPCKPFRLEPGMGVTRARSIVSSWQPQSYAVGQTVQQFDVPYVLSNFFNRYISTSEEYASSKLEAKAAKKFLETNFTGRAIDGYVLNHEQLSPLITKMRRIVSECFSERLDVSSLYTLTGHGPNSTTTVEFSSAYLHVKNADLSGTPAGLQQFLHYLRWDDQLRCLLVDKSDELRAMINTLTLNDASTIVDHTITSFVPKKFDSLRTMCPEPTVTAFFAQMIAKFITQRLSKLYNIDLRTQTDVHKDMARLGSIIADLFIATIDWSEASDRIWTSLVEAVMSEGNGPQWFSFMNHVCRVGKTSVSWKGCIGHQDDFATEEELTLFLSSRSATYTVEYGKGKRRPLYKATCVVDTTMFATMGNPITFPLQTLIFYSFLEACTEIYSEQAGVALDDLTFPSSFGDDGIVDSRAFGIVSHYADLLGWRLNADKSFTQDAFRESCGGDYYSGRYCRPFQPTGPEFDENQNLSLNKKRYQAWLYVCANNTALLCETLGKDPIAIERWLVEQHKLVKLGKVLLVPPSYSDGSGYRVKGLSDGMQLTTYSDWATSDIFSLDKRGLLHGHGWDGPQIEFGAPKGASDRCLSDYSWPVFFAMDRVFQFYTLASVPGRIELDLSDQAHYYLENLKKSAKQTLGYTDDSDYVVHRNVFNQHKRGAVLDSEGAVPVKECRLYKTKATVSSWR